MAEVEEEVVVVEGQPWVQVQVMVQGMALGKALDMVRLMECLEVAEVVEVAEEAVVVVVEQTREGVVALDMAQGMDRVEE